MSFLPLLSESENGEHVVSELGGMHGRSGRSLCHGAALTTPKA